MIEKETKFPCSMLGDTDSLTIDWSQQDRIFFDSVSGHESAEIALGRKQVESLRDQLNAWLAERAK
jgi:hypothetical protein